jgi:endo-1,4-beta-xylanase
MRNYNPSPLGIGLPEYMAHIRKLLKQGILMWGFWEGANWIPSSSMYKRDWSPTPTAEAYKNLIFKEWWTKESGVTGRKGEFSTQAFFGKYKVTVNGISKEIDLTRENSKITISFN